MANSAALAFVRGTFTGRPKGWLPGETSTALALTHKVLLQKPGYLNQFRAAFDADISTSVTIRLWTWLPRAIAAFSNPQSPSDELSLRQVHSFAMV